MKKAFIVLIIIVVSLYINCASSQKYHEGYICTFERQPIPDLRVYYDYQSRYCTAADSAGGTTDKNGYFRFRQGYWPASRLNIESNGKIIDSIGTINFQAWDKKFLHFFVDGRTDTFFIDTGGKRKSYNSKYKPHYYEGYICTFEKQPIQNLKIYPYSRLYSCITTDSVGVITDEKGYFKCMIAEDMFDSRLIVELEGKIVDSIETIAVSRLNRRIKPFYRFVEGRVDTFFIDMRYKSWLSRKRYGQEPVAEKSEPLLDDRDGQQYSTVRIGNRRWMAENLNIRTGNSRCYNDDETYCNAYGRLYDWETAIKACPAGWHLPYSRHEWGEMLIAAGGIDIGDGIEVKHIKNVGNKLKATSGWRKEIGNGTDDYGFSALSGGLRDSDDKFKSCGSLGGWWTATAYDEDKMAIYYGISDDYVERCAYSMSYGYSVRCVQNVAPTLVSTEKVGQGEVDARDGRQYRTVQIGNRTWMAENLNYDAERSWCYGNDESNCGKYGRLYEWKTAMQACPAGWRLPTRGEWVDLVVKAGPSIAGKKLKAKSGWGKKVTDTTCNGTDDYGFSALPGGHYEPSEYMNAGYNGYWWTATEGGVSRAYSLKISCSDDVSTNRKSGSFFYDDVDEPKQFRSSVRCVRNDE